MKRIGIDARFYGEAGPGRYIKNILRELEKLEKPYTSCEFLIFLRKKGFDDYQPTNPRFKKVLADFQWYSFDEQTRFLFLLYWNRINLLYVPHFNIPVLYFGKLISAIPDLIMHYYSTEEATTLPKVYFKFKKLVYYFVVLWSVIRSRKIIVPSTDVKNDFLRVYPFISKDKYVVAYEGVDADFLKTPLSTDTVLLKYNITAPFLLYVGSMYTHKNLKNLIMAFASLKKSQKFGGQLVLIGKKDTFSQKLSEFIVQNALQSDVLIPGLTNYVTDQEVVALRKAATLYVFPSLKEGFSLTPLEAQAVGLACVISDIPCHREIYGDSVLYFDPNDVLSIEKNILLGLTNTKQLVEKGYQNSSKYNWYNTGLQTCSIIDSQ